MREQSGGRPSGVTKAVRGKLEEAFMLGLDDREACCYAGVAQAALDRYCGRHKAFFERKEILKYTVTMQAKINLANSIENGSIPDSKYYLERKCRDEFSTSQKVTVEGAVKNPYAGLTDDELRKLIDSG